MKTIENVMTAFPHTIGHDQSLTCAVEMMTKYGIRHLPVCKAGKLIGIISERDIEACRRFEQERAETLTIEDACTLDPYIVEKTASLKEVSKMMADWKIGCTLIATKGKLEGIFTTADACRVLHEIL